ncbi:MAG: selenoprotein B, partial [Pseudomonadota bacterium]|nr:selenoprotein B [Pseudomonadota bacterium]
MRENTERLRPPRFLWVPFELGRPFGAPDEPEFQTRVLRDVLALFEHAGPSPVLEDFVDDAPGQDMDMTGWTCPIPLPKTSDSETPELLSSVLSEIENLAPWHQIAVKRRGRTATGVLGIPIYAVATFLHDIFERVPESPKDGVPVGQAFRQGCEELKTFYLEAATAKPGVAKSYELADWFWGGTAGGRLLLSLHPAALESADEEIKQVAQSQMVPRAQA